MNENKKECIILGFRPYADKNTNEEMLRIVIGVTNVDDYVGIAPVQVFLPSSTNLMRDLGIAINENKKVYYITKENISTGKTRVVAFEF